MKLFRKLTVLALAVLLVCALSTSAFAVNRDTQSQVCGDGTVTSTIWIEIGKLTGEICSFPDQVCGGYYQMRFTTHQLYHDGYTQTVIYWEDGNWVTSDSVFETIQGNLSEYYFTQVSCRFQTTVTVYGSEYSYDQTSAVIYP